MVDHLVGLSDGSFRMDDGDGVDFMHGVVDVSAAVVDDLTALRVGGLVGHRVDELSRFAEVVARSGGSASQDGADDDLEN